LVNFVLKPGYRNWAQWLLPMLDSSISAACEPPPPAASAP
jgi:hypothetical protein